MDELSGVEGSVVDDDETTSVVEEIGEGSGIIVVSGIWFVVVGVDDGVFVVVVPMVEVGWGDDDDEGRGRHVVTSIDSGVVVVGVEVCPKLIYGFSLAEGGNCHSVRLSGFDVTFGTM